MNPSEPMWTNQVNLNKPQVNQSETKGPKVNVSEPIKF